jgi:anti-anti-sigma factor
MALILSEKNVGPITLLELSERLTIDTLPELRDKIEALAAQGRRSFLLDCARINVIDSRGIGGFVKNWVSLKKQGGALKLLNPSHRLQEVLQVIGLHKVIESYDDIGTALRMF